MKFALLLLLLAVLAGCGPSCEERGGKRKFSHNSMIWTGKAMILIPQYRCEGAKDVN